MTPSLIVIGRFRLATNLERLGINPVYIGRPNIDHPGSALANPYSAEAHGRMKAIELYRVWLRRKIRLENPEVIAALTAIRNKVRAGEEVTLLCWCAPRRCHGEVIAEAVLSWEF